ncbi:sulfatase family protein [Wenyingzhuangia sp. IMCC45574]
MKLARILPYALGTLLLLTNCKTVTKEKASTTSLKKKPNIIYLLTDQWRGSALGYAGNPDVKTPHLDAFSKRAVNFTNAVSVTPICTTHRAALFTGRYPTTTGMVVNDVYLPAEELTIAEIFKKEGYNTAYWGKWHLDGHGRETYIPKERRQGFEFWRALECSHSYNKMPYYDNNNPEKKYWKEYSPFAIAKDANKYLEAHALDAKPFLAVVSIAAPHYPHGSAPKKYKNLYNPDSLTLNPNVAEKYKASSRKELQGYYAHATATDEAIGLILNKIKELKIEDNTIIVFSADHGEMMGAHGVKPFVKQLAWDESIRVPFLISYPNIGENKGATVYAPINTPDVLPSLLGLTGIKVPKVIQGEDLSDLIRNPDPKADRVALVMNAVPFGSNHRDPEYRAIRTNRYTYTKTLQGPSMLFDNVKDPYQLNNLLDDKNYEAIKQDLDQKLKLALESVNDEFKPREYYMNKWGYSFGKKKNAIPFWLFEKGTGVVQSPKPVN